MNPSVVIVMAVLMVVVPDGTGQHSVGAWRVVAALALITAVIAGLLSAALEEDR